MHHRTLQTLASSCFLALVLLGCGQADHATQTPAAAATSTTADFSIKERPAAVPASAKEWADIQKFIQRIWAISTKVGEAQERLQRATTLAADKLDITGILAAEKRHLGEIDRVQAAIEHTYVPKVANADGQIFVSKAYTNLRELILLERRQAQAVIKAFNDPNDTPPEEELARMTHDINMKTGFTVMSLHRLYWTYGYSDDDFDEKNFALKSGAKPSAKVSFNRGND